MKTGNRNIYKVLIIFALDAHQTKMSHKKANSRLLNHLQILYFLR